MGAAVGEATMVLTVAEAEVESIAKSSSSETVVVSLTSSVTVRKRGVSTK